MKKCTKCKVSKSELDFHKDKYQKSGLSCICKKCNRIKVLKYKRTKKGLISTIYSTQKATSKKRGYPLPDYTLDQFINWVMSQDIFHILYDDWVKNDYPKNLIPSCDRLSDYYSYKLCNIQIMTWEENNNKHYEDVCCGKNTKYTTPIIVIDLTKQTKINYYSIAQASRDLKINTARIHKGLRENKTIKNYKFKRL